MKVFVDIKQSYHTVEFEFDNVKVASNFVYEIMKNASKETTCTITVTSEVKEDEV